MDDQSATSSRVFIVARRHPELYDYLKSRFADDTTVMVVLDRRLAPRRRRALPAAAERRRADRRSRPEVDERLTSTSLAIVGGSAAPVSEARQWVEAMQRGVQAVRGALDNHDRLFVILGMMQGVDQMALIHLDECACCFHGTISWLAAPFSKRLL